MSELDLDVNVDVKNDSDLDRVNSQLETTEKRTSSLGNVGIGVFQGIGQAVAGFGLQLADQAISAGIDAIGNSITLASDKAEAASKVNVLFGQSADVITRASQTAATSVGLSSGAYLEAAGNLGNLLTNFGFAGDAAADMSVDMIGLAADMGSFNNADPSEVVEAMGAAFRGESEPIRRFGVMLSEATIQAKAIELGLYDGVGALDANARATATYQLILDQTTAAQGDFARTSDGLANGQRIAAAKMEDAWTRVGEKLEPIAAEILPMIADGIVELVDGIGVVVDGIQDWIKDNQGLVNTLLDLGRILWDNVIKYVQIFLEVIGELGYRIGGLIGLFVDLAGAMVDAGSAIIHLLQGDFEGAAEAGQRALDRLQGFQENVQRAMGDTARRMADNVEASFGVVDESVDAAMSDSINALAGGYAAAADTAAAGGEDLGRSGAAGTESGLRDGLPGVKDASSDLANTLPQELTQGQREAQRIAAQTPGEIAAGLRSTRDNWRSALDLLKDDMQSSMDRTKEIARLEAALSGKAIQQGLASTDPIVRAQAQETVDLIEARLATLGEVGRAAGGDVGGGVASALRAKYDDVGNAANGLARIIEKKLELGSPADSGPWSKRGGPVAWMGRNADLMLASFERSWDRGLRSFDPGSFAAPSMSGAAGSGSVYQITVNAGVGDPVAIGRDVVSAIQAYERSGGRDWRSAA